MPAIVQKSNDVLSEHTFIAVKFKKSPANTYKLALEKAKTANFYSEVIENGTLWHCASFAPTKEGALAVSELFEIIKGWKGVQVTTQTIPLTSFIRVSETLKCFSESFEKSNFKDHCVSTVKILPSMGEINQFMTGLSSSIADPNSGREADLPKHGANVLPCKLLRGFALTGRFGTDPPNPEQLVLETANSRSCAWCPNFDIKNYMRIYGPEERKPQRNLQSFWRKIKTAFERPK